MNFGKDIYEVTTYSPITIVQHCEKANISISEIKKTSDFTYEFTSSFFNRKKIKTTTMSCKIIKKTGILSIFEHLLLHKITLLCILTSLLAFNLFSNLIFGIEIQGDAQSLESEIFLHVDQFGIKIGKPKLNYDQLKTLEKNIQEVMDDKIEWIEVRNRGVIIYIRYLKRRIPPVIEGKKENLIATRDGMVRYFELESGEKKVTTNQYVTKGMVLVSGYILDHNGENKYVGCKGRVMGNIWKIVTAEMAMTTDNELENYMSLLSLARDQIIQEFDVESEMMEKESVLQFEAKDSKIVMKVHYTLLVDLSRE